MTRCRSPRGTRSITPAKASWDPDATESAARFPFGVSRTSVCRPSSAPFFRVSRPERSRPARFRLAVEGSIPKMSARDDVDTAPRSAMIWRVSACWGVTSPARARSRPSLPRPRATECTARANLSWSAIGGAVLYKFEPGVKRERRFVRIAPRRAVARARLPAGREGAICACRRRAIRRRTTRNHICVLRIARLGSSVHRDDR